jgi:endonuclease/exonuclease/phosphatase family metal-dependent hydrolase
MVKLKVTSFNGEWMNDWFLSGASVPKFKTKFKDRESNKMIDTDTVASKVAKVIRSINPDILAIQEGPSEKKEMQLFIDTYLGNQGYKCETGSDGSSQKIHLLYKQEKFASTKKVNAGYDAWEFDRDGDYDLENIKFTRTPLEMDFEVNVSGGDGGGEKKLKVISVHLKSPFVQNGQQMWKNPDTRRFYVAEALQSRRRTLTEATEIRKRVDSIFDKSPGIVILGDMNDGPGKEYFEKFLLGMDITGELLGNVYYPKNIFTTTLDPEKDYTVIFDDFVENQPKKKILLDRILISPSFVRRLDAGRVEHNAYDSQVTDPESREGRPSDHRPVSILLDL